MILTLKWSSKCVQFVDFVAARKMCIRAASVFYSGVRGFCPARAWNDETGLTV